ncbi:hypothetical protein LZG04_27135 [Saccharothrix sp. S26]|uniref:hypothetical protein n=1 Tax=Saccharothrix sp. S26 TaxID=2907215 RepID=UPI001F2A9ED4|nr:hypothetical protein [Saccharothrix sp. S26]MCE6998447.1 hypothetical protein [Saccharothrix sp. S26]
MTGPEDAASRLDELDLAILDQVRAVQQALDPPPADLDTRSRFALRLADVDIEVARLYEDVLAGAGARSAEPVRTLTFESADVTIMLTVAERAGELRVEGWLAPPGPLRVELRTDDPAGTRHVVADDGGRFVFDGVTRGLAQLAVPRPAGPTVVTPPVSL